MRTSRYITLASAAVMVGIAAGADNPQAQAQVQQQQQQQPGQWDPSQVYDIIFDQHPPGDARLKGNCARWAPKIKMAFNELLTMIRDTQIAISEFQEPMPNAERDPEGYDEYMKVAQAFWVAFAKFENPTEEKKWKDYALAQYTRWLNFHNPHSSDHQNKDRRYYIRCGDEFLKWLGPKDKHPLLKDGSTMAKPNPKSQYHPFPKGAWYAANLGAGDQFFAAELLPNVENKNNPVCDPALRKRGPGVHAEAIFDKIMVLCEDVLEQKDWSIIEIAQGLYAPDKTLKPDQPLDLFSHTLAQTLLHELGHLVSKWSDHPALGFDGSVANPHDEVTDGGWTQCWLLARYYPQHALKSPENFALFAVMMFNSKQHWASGVAREMPLNVMQMRHFLQTPLQWKTEGKGPLAAVGAGNGGGSSKDDKGGSSKGDKGGKGGKGGKGSKAGLKGLFGGGKKSGKGSSSKNP